MLLTRDQSNTVLPPPLQSSDELLWPILGSQRERQNLAADHFDGKQQVEKRRLDTGKTLSYFEVKPVQPMGGSSVIGGAPPPCVAGTEHFCAPWHKATGTPPITHYVSSAVRAVPKVLVGKSMT